MQEEVKRLREENQELQKELGVWKSKCEQMRKGLKEWQEAYLKKNCEILNMQNEIKRLLARIEELQVRIKELEHLMDISDSVGSEEIIMEAMKIIKIDEY